jgi:hypothetical protein
MGHSPHASTRIDTRRWTRGLLRRHLHRAGLWRRLLLTHRPLARRLLAEFVGNALLVTIVVGSGIAAERLSPGQAGLQLLANSTATALGLAVCSSSA